VDEAQASADTSRQPPRIAVVAARDEVDRIAATIGALREASPGIAVVVADDASTDGTAEAALAAGAQVVRRGRSHGKGGNVTAACDAALSDAPLDAVFLLCDGDLGESAGRLLPLLEAVESNECDLAIAAFARRVGGGIGAAKGFARWAIRVASGFEAREPISGQRAMRALTLRSLLPFAPGYGMETAMTIDAVRNGSRVREIELDLSHRATGRTLGGFVHRGRQLRDIARAYASRRAE
jgi:glycosyltransferase involved in cell wall biosynthesis